MTLLLIFLPISIAFAILATKADALSVKIDQANKGIRSLDSGPLPESKPVKPLPYQAETSPEGLHRICQQFNAGLPKVKTEQPCDITRLGNNALPSIW